MYQPITIVYIISDAMFTDCEAIWKKLNSVYGAHITSMDSQMSVHKQLNNIQKYDDEYMEKFLSRVDNINIACCVGVNDCNKMVHTFACCWIFVFRSSNSSFVFGYDDDDDNNNFSFLTIFTG